MWLGMQQTVRMRWLACGVQGLHTSGAFWTAGEQRLEASYSM